MKRNDMDKASRVEHDFSGGVPGKYADRYAKGVKTIVARANRKRKGGRDASEVKLSGS